MGPIRRQNSVMSTFASQAIGEDEVRFAELLKPIKDLSENWSVPLAQILENYYEELTDLQISLDGQNTTVRIHLI